MADADRRRDEEVDAIVKRFNAGPRGDSPMAGMTREEIDDYLYDENGLPH